MSGNNQTSRRTESASTASRLTRLKNACDWPRNKRSSVNALIVATSTGSLAGKAYAVLGPVLAAYNAAGGRGPTAPATVLGVVARGGARS